MMKINHQKKFLFSSTEILFSFLAKTIENTKKIPIKYCIAKLKNITSNIKLEREKKIQTPV